MWGYNHTGKRSDFEDRHRILFSLSSNDNERKNLALALKLKNYGVFLTQPDDSTKISAGSFIRYAG